MMFSSLHKLEYQCLHWLYTRTGPTEFRSFTLSVGVMFTTLFSFVFTIPLCFYNFLRRLILLGTRLRTSYSSLSIHSFFRKVYLVRRIRSVDLSRPLRELQSNLTDDPFSIFWFNVSYGVSWVQGSVMDMNLKRYYFVWELFSLFMWRVTLNMRVRK